jgi:hypothetical protein
MASRSVVFVECSRAGVCVCVCVSVCVFVRASCLSLRWWFVRPHRRSPSKRGCGLNFGPDITKKFLDDNGLQLLVRSHEVKMEGRSTCASCLSSSCVLTVRRVLY